MKTLGFDRSQPCLLEIELANFPHHNVGLLRSEAFECLDVFCASPKCAGLVLTELNPDHDGDGSLVPTFTRLLVQALSRPETSE